MLYYGKNLPGNTKEQRQLKKERLERCKIDFCEHTDHITENNTIEKIIYNNPATIVFFSDGTKEVVKCHRDEDFSEEIGVAMAIVNKVFGSRHQFLKEVDKWIIEKDDNSINRGDWVRVSDPLEQYPRWVELFSIVPELKPYKGKFIYGKDIDVNEWYKVCEIIKEPGIDGSEICLLENNNRKNYKDGVFLVNLRGLSK